MINFALPGFYENQNIIIILCSLIKLYPNIFYDNININAVYGNFSLSTWDGGRIFESYPVASKEDMVDIYNAYNNELEIPIRFIFTNPLLTQEHCFEKYNNFIVSQFENGINEIVVNSPILEEYLRNNYPNYTFISSTTKCLSLQDLKKEIDNPNYKLVCWDYNLNHNKELINNLTQEQKDKCELLINAICGEGCPYRAEHYKLNGIHSLTYGKNFTMRGCNIKKSVFTPNRKCNNISTQEIIEEYYPKGFTHFKLEGRTYSDLDLTLELTRFLVKPEWKEFVLAFILRNIETFSIKEFSLQMFKERYAAL